MFSLEGFQPISSYSASNSSPSLRIQSKGVIFLNNAARKVFPDSKKVSWLYNPKTKMIALKEEENDGPGTVKISSVGNVAATYLIRSVGLKIGTTVKMVRSEKGLAFFQVEDENLEEDDGKSQ